MKATSRPIFNAVLKYRYPVMAIASILHRISGVILFLFIPLLLWTLSQTLTSETDFQSIQTVLKSPLYMIVLWLLLAALIYHLLAGTRHMIMDMGFAESLRGGRIGAYFVIILTVLLLLWVWLWL